jgi:hypothetical protein
MPLAATGEVSAGPIGLLVLLLIGVATVLLVRNMNARLKRMPREFPPPAPRGGRQPHEIDPRGDDRL